VVNIDEVSFGSPDSRITRIAVATARPTLSDSPPSGVMLNATSTVRLHLDRCLIAADLLVTSEPMNSQPLPFDPIARAAGLWEERIGPSSVMGAVTSVMRVQQILQSAVDAALRPHGLTFARFEALVLLYFSKRGSLPMRVMGQRLQLHPTSVTNIVDRLEGDGLVKRIPHPTDRRTTLVEITEPGRARRERATEAVNAVDFGLTGLTDRQTEALFDLLAKVRRASGDYLD
jgi:DNA-binding MarR family transcriptional regulator